MGSGQRRIAVVYATGQGTTKEIAEFIGATLQSAGLLVEVAPVDRAPDLSEFHAVVLGSAVYHEAFMKSFVIYAHQQLDTLAAMDVWLFSVGMAPALRGAIGRRVARSVPKQIAMVRDALSVRGYRAFAGRYERVGLPLPTRLRYFVLGGRRFGDLRDWDDIRAWASSIASAPASAPRPVPDA